MKIQEGRLGRIFVIRLENGDRLPDAIEKFASQKKVRSASCILLGGLGPGNVVVGPADSDARPPKPMIHEIGEAHEAVAVGAIFPDATGTPRLHMHAAMGRDGRTVTGCVRPGIETWVVGECIVHELLDVDMARLKDPETGFELLAPKD